MMSRNPSQRVMLLKYAFAAPVFFLLVAFFVKPNNVLMTKTAALGATVTQTVDKIEAQIHQNAQIIHPLTLENSLTATIDSARNPQTFNLSDPMVRLAGRSHGLISKETLRNQAALSLIQPISEPYVICAIQSFQVIRVPFGLQSNQESKNTSQKFNAATLALIQQAQNGDSYQFVNIKGRCPGDAVARNLPNMVFIVSENKEDTEKNAAGAAYMLDKELAKLMPTSDDCHLWKEGDTGNMPVFPGGEAEVEKFVYSNLRYPEECKKSGRECMFIVSYSITTEGYVIEPKNFGFKWTDPRAKTSAQTMAKFEATDQPMIDEALRVIKSMPRWKPGTRNGVISCHSKTFLFKFQLDK